MADIEIAKKSDLISKSDVGHTHNISDITNLSNELAQKADSSHKHDGVYQPVGNYASETHTHPYSEIEGTPTIPASTSDLENDSGFITEAYDNSGSGLNATNIQAAIDELKSLIDALNGASDG